MSDSIPGQIGPYRVIREIGRGGMGVVFLARDTKLDRDVAIKALPLTLAEDADRMARFEREAKTLAQLNHSHIAGIHGVEEQDGQRYLILEYVEGETLAERLDRGPLPVDEAIEIAVEIAVGVEAAHEAGVVHRDLKPDNVKITPGGKVKVLDFGLARTDDGASSSSAAGAATVTTPARHSPTIAGAILGTAAYMSPEQARGRRVDKRTDVWSFGVVLYEMLAGSNLFLGETATDTIGAVLHKEFRLDGLPKDTPRMVRHVLHRCLERDRARRFQSIGDVRIELEDARKRIETGQPDDLGSTRSGPHAWIWPALAASFALTTLAGLALWLNGPKAPSDLPPVATPPTVLRVEQITDFPLRLGNAAVSPDGVTVVYSARREGERADLYRLRIGGATPIRLTQGAAAHEDHATVSPNGESVAYWGTGDAQGVYVMGATGESPRRIVEAPAFHPAWSPDGRSLAYTTDWWDSVYSRGNASALWIVDLNTRERRLVDTKDPGATVDDPGWRSDATGASWSPDGSRIAYWGHRGGTRDIFTVSANGGGDVVRITDDLHTDWNPVWGRDGRSIWFSSDRGGQSGVWWIALTAEGRPIGAPRPIAVGPANIKQFSLAADGRTMVARVATARHRIERVRFDPDTERFVGSPEILVESSTEMSAPDISRDGEWIAFTSGPPQEDITVMRIDGTGRRRLTESVARDRVPRWSPDGKTLWFYTNERGDYELRTIDRDTAEARARPIEGARVGMLPTISPDGTRILFSAGDEALQLAKLTEDAAVVDARALPETFAHTGSTAWSPDGRWITGRTATRGGKTDRAVIDTDTDTVVPLRTPDGEPWAWFSSATWIDARRLLVYARLQAQHAAVCDVISGESRWVEDAPALAGSSITFLDGWLYSHHTEESSHLWLVTFEGSEDR